MSKQLPEKPDNFPCPLPHPRQWDILKHPARFRVVACGRRFGKTETGKLDLIMTAFDGGLGWWVSPTHKMALDVWQSFLTTLEPYADRIDRSNHVIYMPHGGEIRVQSGHEPERLRGAGLDSVIIDEAAFCEEAVWTVLRPALADRSGRALFLSTPRGRNWFWHLYQRGLDPLHKEWHAYQMPSAANPLLPPGEVEAARRDMPQRMFQQEMEAAFLDDYGTVFRGVLSCVLPGDMPNQASELICFGLDWGRVDDFTVIMVMGMQSKTVYAVERFQQISWSMQRERVKTLAKKWRPQVILAEANSIGSPNIEALASDGLPIRPFTMTAHNKGTLVDALTSAIEQQLIRLPNHPVLIHELQAFEMEPLTSGGYRYSAPSGGHDDCVIALMLAYHAATHNRTATVRPYA